MSDSRLAACIIVAGKVGAGKTSSIRALAEKLASEGIRVAGALQPDSGRKETGGAKGFNLELIASPPCCEGGLMGGSHSGGLVSRSLSLAREKPEGAAPGPSQLSHGRYLFELDSFAAAEVFFRGFLGQQGKECAPDLVFIDEIGKLELERGEGLRPCLDLVLGAIRAPGTGRASREGARPRLIVLAARDLNAQPLRGIVEAEGVEAAIIPLPEGRGSLLPEARKALMA